MQYLHTFKYSGAFTFRSFSAVLVNYFHLTSVLQCNLKDGPQQFNRTECKTGRDGQNDDFRPLPHTLGGMGHGVQGQICEPSYNESVPAPSGHTDSHTLDTYFWRRALILDRWRAFDLFASVDAHL